MSTPPVITGFVTQPAPPPPTPTPTPPLGGDPVTMREGLSRMVDLPSGGVFYRTGVRQVAIRPTRGDQEIAIAGTAEGSVDRVRAIRHAVQQCTDLRGLLFSELVLPDFAALALHVTALSAGTDEVTLDVPCKGCKRPLAPKPVEMTMLPCVSLRIRMPDDPAVVQTPAPQTYDDPDLEAAARVERKLAAAKDAGLVTVPTVRWVSPQDVREPFTASLAGGHKVTWRHLRIADIEATEEFAIETGVQGEGAQAMLTPYLTARQIVAIDGASRGTVGAMAWIKSTESPVLNGLWTAIAKQTFGYDMTPEFACGNAECSRRGQKVKVRLPNDGSMFRSRHPAA